jgi:hypothetical protein
LVSNPEDSQLNADINMDKIVALPTDAKK